MKISFCECISFEEILGHSKEVDKNSSFIVRQSSIILSCMIKHTSLSFAKTWRNVSSTESRKRMSKPVRYYLLCRSLSSKRQ